MPARERLAEALNLINEGGYTVTVALATFDKGEDGPTYRSLNIADAVAEGFSELARKSLSSLTRALTTGDTVMRPYQDDYIPERHEVEHVVTDEEFLAAVVDVPSPSHIPLIGDDDVTGFVDRVRFYILIFSRGNRRVVLFRKYNKNKELVRSKYFITRLLGDRLESIEEPLFQFDPNVDVILYRGELFILNRESFRQIFRYYDMLVESARQALDAIAVTIPIANFNEFEQSCLGHVQKLKKLRSIAHKPYLAEITMEDLKGIVDSFELNVQFNQDGELIFDSSDRWAILHLLDDAYLDSNMTGLQYEANSKREM